MQVSYIRGLLVERDILYSDLMYSRTPLIRPPSESHWCGRIRGMVAREGFVYEQKPLSVTRNVVVWEGWSLVRVVVRQGFYCTPKASCSLPDVLIIGMQHEVVYLFDSSARTIEHYCDVGLTYIWWYVVYLLVYPTRTMEHDSEPSLSSRYGYEQRVSANSRPAPPASNSSQYERRVEKYERHEQPASSRYTERRASHETVHRDRDDRSRVAETRPPKYDRCVFTLSINLTFSFPIQYLPLEQLYYIH